MFATIYEPEHEDFRMSVRGWLESEVVPHDAEWRRRGAVDRGIFKSAGALGFFGANIPETYGGGGSFDFRFNAVLSEEIQRAGVRGAGLGLTLHNDVCVPYFVDASNDEQKARWLPGICAGELIAGLAMTEPAAGSDVAGIRTRAVREGDHYVVNGAKTFISNGQNADLLIVAVRTDASSRHGGLSLLVAERDTPGLQRGPLLNKVGLHAQDTVELFFDGARIPAANRLGEEGDGFHLLMRNLAQERMSVAVAATAAAQTALDLTVEYCTNRQAFGKPLAALQAVRLRLAEMVADVEVTRAYVDRCVLALNDGSLTPADAATAKWWTSDVQHRVVDGAVQLHGGVGFMADHPIGRAYADARASRIYAGANDVMKDVAGRSLTNGAGKAPRKTK